MARAVECPGCGEDVPPNGTKVVDCPSCGATVTFPFAVKGPGGEGGADGSRRSTGRSANRQGMRGEESAAKFYRDMGCAVYEIRPLARMRGVSKGIPDLTVFAEDCGAAPAPYWYHEVKTGENARQSPEQLEFQKRCEAAGIPYVLGDARDAARFLGFDV